MHDSDPFQDDVPEDALQEDLHCPACVALLTGTEAFEFYRVCEQCGRHFGMPARERISLIVDPGAFAETSSELISLDPVLFHDRLPVADRLSDSHERSIVADAVITGLAEIGEHETVVVALDAAYIGGAIGVLAGEKIALAFELALERRLPLVALCAGGGVRTQDGMLAVLQMAKIATLGGRMHREGLPIITILTHPTTGGVMAGLANQGDFIYAEPGVTAGSTPAAGQGLAGGMPSSEALLEAGLIDEIIVRPELRLRLMSLLHLLGTRGTLHIPAEAPEEPRRNSPAWEAVRIAREPDRPSAAMFARRVLADIHIWRGDRVGGDDAHLIGGIARFEGLSVAFFAHDCRNGEGGPQKLSIAAYRKASRIMQLAARLELPLLSFVDTAGAVDGYDAELAGISVALAQNLSLMGQSPAPVMAIITGEAGGPGALANALGDRVLATEYALFSMPMVEGATSHPFFVREQHAQQGGRGARVMSAREALSFGVVDGIVPEPEGGAHLDPEAAANALRQVISIHLAELLVGGSRRLAEERLRRARLLGLAAPEGDATAWRELRELHALQHTVSRSIDDFRHDLKDRLEHGRQALPQLTTRLPKRSELATRLATLRETVAQAATSTLDRREERKTRPQDEEPAERD